MNAVSAPSRRSRSLRSLAAGGAVGAVPRLKEAFLLPGENAGEWLLLRRTLDGSTPAPRECPSLEAAVRMLAPEEAFTLAVPLDLAIVQRMTLPSAPGEELRDMARIQMEKILPYASEALGLDCQPIEAADAETTLAVYAVYNERLLQLGKSFAALGRWPRQVTLTAVLKAAAAVRSGADSNTVLLIYQEAGRTVAGIVEQGTLSFAQALPAGTSPQTELPTLLLGAELEGIPTDFTRVLLDSACAEWREPLATVLHLPIDLLPPLPPEGLSVPGDLTPAAWNAERLARRRVAGQRRRILIGVAVYAALLLLALADNAVLHFRRSALDRQLAEASPRLEGIDQARKRSQALAPATDWRLSTVEILEQIRECLPAGDLRITVFDLSFLQTPPTLTIEGEAPSYEMAVDVGEKMKAKPELRAFTFVTEPPRILENNRAHFSITGKLRQ